MSFICVCTQKIRSVTVFSVAALSAFSLGYEHMTGGRESKGKHHHGLASEERDMRLFPSMLLWAV